MPQSVLLFGVMEMATLMLSLCFSLLKVQQLHLKNGKSLCKKNVLALCKF